MESVLRADTVEVIEAQVEKATIGDADAVDEEGNLAQIHQRRPGDQNVVCIEDASFRSFHCLHYTAPELDRQTPDPRLQNDGRTHTGQ